MRIFGRFIHDQQGAVAAEMAVIAPLFVLMLLSIVEMGLTLFSQSVLDGAARDAARLIRTGQVQGAQNPAGTLQNLVCSRVSMLMTCSNVIIDVQQFPNFGAVAFQNCAPPQNPCPFQPGQGGQVIGLRLTYNRQFLVPWVGACLTGGPCWLGPFTGNPNGVATNQAVLRSTVVFQNEPFPAGG
jgi:Flp pilus assembly pilin Flp